MISVLHATRGRDEQMWQAFRWYVEKASGDFPVEYIFSCDDDDVLLTNKEFYENRGETPPNARIPACASTKDMTRAFYTEWWLTGAAGVGLPSWLKVKHVSGMPANNVCAWNRAAAAATGKLFFQSSDDFEPPDNWDKKVVRALGGSIALSQPLVLGVGDPHGPVFYTGRGSLEYYICTSAYVERCGYYLYPEYPTFGVVDLNQKAILEDALVDAYDSIHFIHHWHGGQQDPECDSIYRREHIDHPMADPKKGKDLRNQLDADRRNCGYLDIRLDADPKRMLVPEHELFGPHLSFEERMEVWRRRHGRGFANLQNKEPPHWDPRALFHKGRYKQALDGFYRLRDKQSKLCGGRMRIDGLEHLIRVCEQHV